MKNLIQKLIILLICTAEIWSDCDDCQSSNMVACHNENQYSLCIKGVPTKNLVTCPENHVCTSGPYVCYPLTKAKPSCVRKRNLCGVCNHNKVYACTNETTIAFCYGQNEPLKGEDVSYCLGGTVCDIYSENGFCSERYLAKPSCITTSDVIATESTTKTTTSKVTSTTKKPFITTTIQPDTTTRTPERTTKITTAKPKTTTTTQAATKKPITLITTIEPTTTTRKPTAGAAVTKPKTTTLNFTTTTTKQTTKTTKAKPFLTIKPTTTPTSKEPVKPILDPESTNSIAISELTNTTTTTTTTASPPPIATAVTPSIQNNPVQFCKNAATTGAFYAGDPTCTTFVLCYKMNGSIIGIQKECPSTQYFAPGAKSCSLQKPDVCI